MLLRTLTLASLTVALTTPAAYSQGTAAKAPVDDTLFANAAALGGMAELSISELGVQKATDPELKRFSQQMIDDHTRMNGQLTALANQKRIPLPRMVDPRAQFCAQALAGLSGEEFDRCYAKAQLVAHMDAVATFEAEAERGRDPQMKALATEALPRIKDHLKMIKPIATKYEKD
jgi:putative membrane protein